MMTRIVLLLVLGLATALPAAAQNASTAGALDLYGTYHAVGARLTFTGDANANATARLEWRLQGAPTWTTGMPMTRITNSRWAASVLWLQPDTPYEVRAVIIDPDGGGSTTGSIRTRTPASTTPTGATIWVATNGSDGNNGTSGAPLATLQAAADRANPGDQIRVRPGLYYQSVDVGRAGSASAMIHLVADGPGVILDGSDPAYLNRSDWRDDGGGVFSVPYTGTTRLVCADSLMRLYHHASLANLNAATYGVTQGWAAEGGRLYVKLEGGVSPIGRRMHVARYNIGINLDQSYWRVDGFEIRHFGTVANGGGVVTINANRCVISNNHVHTVGGRNIFMRIGSNEQLVENNLCRDPRIGTWPWDATKAHEEEVQGISDRGGRGSVIRYNTIRGIFDGIDTADFANDENSCADTDIYENLVTDCGDDPIEPESCAGLNLRVWRNRADNSYAGISIAPNSVGPTYVLYNTITNYRTRGYKTSISHTGQTYVFHNTFSSIHTPTAAMHPTGPYSNTHFRNNIMIGVDRACVSDDAGESQTGNDFDGDLLSTNYPALFRWKDVNYSTIAALRSATGFEMNGRTGSPLFVSVALGDYRLSLGSPAIDAAIPLPGVNDAYFGAAPDIGAWEFTSGVDVTPPAAVRDLN